MIHNNNNKGTLQPPLLPRLTADTKASKNASTGLEWGCICLFLNSFQISNFSSLTTFHLSYSIFHLPSTRSIKAILFSQPFIALPRFNFCSTMLKMHSDTKVSLHEDRERCQKVRTFQFEGSCSYLPTDSTIFTITTLKQRQGDFFTFSAEP